MVDNRKAIVLSTVAPRRHIDSRVLLKQKVEAQERGYSEVSTEYCYTNIVSIHGDSIKALT